MSRSTQKVGADPGALEPQHERRRRWSQGKMIGASLVAAAAVVVVAVVGIQLLAPAPTPSLPATPRPGPSPTPAGVVFPAGYVPVGSHSLTVEGVPFSFSVPTSGWERFGSLYISKSTVGPQGAEAVIYWTSFPDGAYAYPCAHLLLLAGSDLEQEIQEIVESIRFG